ncbi:hypothetical protein SLEP1_g32898 [Rubroshorea leprosula]|uniref:Uncharacterized protein n=1 Tax=Rubroshorea leprosula TaxID=152421 RepID=A0AAV5KEY5_9ROSI|nr:hypothetical protein SLEP1_g32898 [Rubroshorea leprosula]
MGLEMEADLEKNCKLVLSPNTVLPPLRKCSKVENRYEKVKTLRKDELLRVKEGFMEISFRHYRSASCKSTSSRPVGVEGNPDLKRDSTYQNSKEVRKMKNMGAVEGRSKIEMSASSDTSFSFRIVDSLCGSDEGSLQERNPTMQLGSNLTSISNSKEQCLSDGFIEICLNSDIRERGSAETLRRDTKDVSFECEPVLGRLDDGNDLLEKDTFLTLPKSHSAKVEVPHSPFSLESECFSRVSSRTRFSPMRKMFDPFMKSRSLRSPFGSVAGGGGKATGMENLMRNRTLRKSLLHDFSYTAQNSELNSLVIKKDHHLSAVASSPVHLHGFLKLVNKHGMPFFEFSMNHLEDVFVAKTWKAENAFNWIYTFHSVGGRKKGNASIWGSNDSSKESPIVGQMHVSCYLCSEVKKRGVSNDSMVTEFVLYDIAHAREMAVQKSTDVCESPASSNPVLTVGSCKSGDGTEALKLKDPSNLSCDNGSFDSSNESKPWASADLHPNLEIAAIVLQVPVGKRESLKYKRGDKSGDKRHLNLLNLSIIEESKKDVHDGKSQEQVKVVIPTGNHCLPCVESQGPSSLLNRWRLGGGCDCGGWDMACPLSILGNPRLKCDANQPLVDSQHPFELFVQGSKDNTLALAMTTIGEGEYAVDFHAQLSTLQAFCICVAVLHGTEASPAAMEQQNIRLAQCNSLGVLIEEEVKFLIKSVTGEEKKKVTKKVKEISPSFVINPPFSPIARV